MVTIKGTEISEEIARDSIEAMEKLIYLYKHPDEFVTCPLCRVPIFGAGCKSCPWYILKNITCEGFDWFQADPRRKRNRIRQLQRWIEIYKKALEAK